MVFSGSTHPHPWSFKGDHSVTLFVFSFITSIFLNRGSIVVLVLSKFWKLSSYIIRTRWPFLFCCIVLCFVVWQDLLCSPGWPFWLASHVLELQVCATMPCRLPCFLAPSVFTTSFPLSGEWCFVPDVSSPPLPFSLDLMSCSAARLSGTLNPWLPYLRTGLQDHLYSFL